jgi:hypothetical protein
VASFASKRYFLRMSKKMSDEQVQRNERDGFVFPVEPRPSLRRFGCAVLAMNLLLPLVACAASDASSDDNRRGGFYGSVSGGMSHP